MAIQASMLGSWRQLSDHYLRAIENPWYLMIANLQHQIHSHTQEFFNQQGIKTLHLPITTGSISSPMGLGSDSLPVEVDLYGIKTYLADSMQFMLEYGCRMFPKGCYYIMPSFRGEEADERHLCQFYHSEAEIPGTLSDVMEMVNRYVKYLSTQILNTCTNELSNFVDNVDHIVKLVSLKTIPQITLEEAIQLLDAYANQNNISKDKFYRSVTADSRALTNYGEAILINMYEGFVWVTHYDHATVPFYQAYAPNDKRKALNADLLFGIGEVVGSGERHVDVRTLNQSLAEHEVGNSEKYDWYVQLKDKYPLQTSGFGMGIERYLLWLLKHHDIRDCQIIPRFNGIDILP